MNLASLVRAVGLRQALSVAIGVLCGMPSGAKSQTTRSCVVAQTPGAQDPVCTTAPRVMTSAAFEQSISFPPLLASANVEGRVDAELAVSDSGRVDERSFRVLSTTHDIFSSAVKAGLRDWRFQAATLDGRAVGATMRIEVAFGLPHSDSMPMEETLTAVASQPGVTRVQIVWRQPPFAPPASVDSAHLYDLVAQIVAERTSKTRDAMGRARCLDWSPTGRGDAPATLITRLRELGVPRLPMSRCSPTYASQFVQLDSLGRRVRRPPGALDPHVLAIADLRPWAPGLFVYTVRSSSGTSGTIQYCQARWSDTRRAWEMRCGNPRTYVS